MAEQTVNRVSSVNASEWAAEILRGRFEEVLSLRDDALRAEDIEGVHQMRVAIRRLRSALRDFAPLLKKRAFRQSNKDLKRLADALGAARDLDVEIAELEKLRGKAKSESVRHGIGKIVEKLRAKREIRQKILTETLEPQAMEALNEHFLKSIDEGFQDKDKNSGETVADIGREVVSRSLQEFCDLSDSLYNPFECARLHELRIIAKRLRYAVELFTVCWGEKIAPFAREIAEMQTFLGEVHDRDIWIEKVNDRILKKEDAKHRTDLWLLSRFVKERTKNYRAALRLWSKWQKDDFIVNLRETLSAKTEE